MLLPMRYQLYQQQTTGSWLVWPQSHRWAFCQSLGRKSLDSIHHKSSVFFKLSCLCIFFFGLQLFQSWGKVRRVLEFCVEVYQCDSTYLSKVWKCPMNSLIATWDQHREYLTTSLQGDKSREKPRENSVIINTIKLINFKGKMWPQKRPFIPGLFSLCNNAQKMRACALESGFRIV